MKAKGFLLLLLAGVLASVVAILTSAMTIRTRAQSSVGVPANSSESSDDRTEVELITIKSSGFAPTEIRRPAGPVILAIENRSGLDLGVLELVSADDAPPGIARLVETEITKHQLNWGERVVLPPGAYTLRRVEQPDWSCRIIVDAR